MAKQVTFQPNKTYATEAHAVKAVERVVDVYRGDGRDSDGLDFFITAGADGRFFPVFVGERAVQAGMHFHFCIIA